MNPYDVAEPTEPTVVTLRSVPLAFELPFPFETAPISENGREHWRTKASKVKGVRGAAYLAAVRARIPDLGRCEVSLTWYVNTKHKRDAENVVPTLKALCDGLVDAGVVRDDTPDLMTKHMPVIQYQPKEENPTPHMVLRVSQILPTPQQKEAA